MKRRSSKILQSQRIDFLRMQETQGEGDQDAGSCGGGRMLWGAGCKQMCSRAAGNTKGQLVPDFWKEQVIDA